MAHRLFFFMGLTRMDRLWCQRAEREARHASVGECVCFFVWCTSAHTSFNAYETTDAALTAAMYLESASAPSKPGPTTTYSGAQLPSKSDELPGSRVFGELLGKDESESTRGRVPARKLLKLPPIVAARSSAHSFERGAVPVAQAPSALIGDARRSAGGEDRVTKHMIGGGWVEGRGHWDSEKLHVYVVAPRGNLGGHQNSASDW